MSPPYLFLARSIHVVNLATRSPLFIVFAFLHYFAQTKIAVIGSWASLIYRAWWMRRQWKWMDLSLSILSSVRSCTGPNNRRGCQPFPSADSLSCRVRQLAKMFTNLQTFSITQSLRTDYSKSTPF